MPRAYPPTVATIADVTDFLSARSAGRVTPLLVAVDGRSGSGKSTLCHALSQVVDAVVLPIDDFFNAHITDAEWDVRDAAARARDALDWRRLRIEALEPLRDGQVARWHAFDFAAGRRSDGSYAFHAAPSTCIPASIVLVDGAYSARPELRDLCDVRVLIELAAPVRESRLRSRESAEFLQAWHARWDAAEERYFTVTSPPSCFDLVVVTPGDAP